MNVIMGRRVGALMIVALVGGWSAGCAEIEKTTPEAAMHLAELRSALEEDKFAVEYQKLRKKEILSEGGNPDWADDIAKLKAEQRYAKRWDLRRDVKEQGFATEYEKLSADVVRICTRLAESGAGWYDIDKCVKKTPAAKYDPLKATGVALGVVVLLFLALVLYRASRKRIDPVALAAGKLGLKATQEREQTTLEGSYKARDLKVEASAPEAGEGSKWMRVQISSGVSPDALVVYGPIAPPRGLQLPDVDMPDTADPRLPAGYRLKLSDGSSAEDLLSGDVGFQIREFDPVDVRVNGGMVSASTWFLFTQPEQVVEFVDLAVSIAECYPPAA